MYNRKTIPYTVVHADRVFCFEDVLQKKKIYSLNPFFSDNIIQFQDKTDAKDQFYELPNIT